MITGPCGSAAGFDESGNSALTPNQTPATAATRAAITTSRRAVGGTPRAGARRRPRRPAGRGRPWSAASDVVNRSSSVSTGVPQRSRSSRTKSSVSDAWAPCLAGQRQRQADDDQLRLGVVDQADQLIHPGRRPHALHDAERTRQRAGRIADRHAGAGAPIVERDHPHSELRSLVRIALSAASTASGSLSGSLPPARAMVARPPPPPPTIGAICLIRSTADRPRSIADWSTLASRCSLALGGAAQHDHGRRQLGLQPVGHLEQGLRIDVLDDGGRRSGCRPPRRRDSSRADSRPLPAALPPPPPDRCCFLTSERSSATSPSRRVGLGGPPAQVVDRDLAGDRLDPADALRRSWPRGGSRTRRSRPSSGHGCRRTAPSRTRGSRPPARARRTSRRTASSRPAGGRVSRSVTKMCTGRFSTIFSLTIRSTSASSSGVIGPSWRKSKRSLSGPTYEPACVTCGPSTWRSAACSRWVAVWCAIVGRRGSRSTCARTRSPAAMLAALDAGRRSAGRRHGGRRPRRPRGRSRTRSRRGRRPGRRRPGRTATRAASA